MTTQGPFVSASALCWWSISIRGLCLDPGGPVCTWGRHFRVICIAWVGGVAGLGAPGARKTSIRRSKMIFSSGFFSFFFLSTRAPMRTRMHGTQSPLSHSEARNDTCTLEILLRGGLCIYRKGWVGEKMSYYDLGLKLPSGGG
jgi:hypothetical protein